MWRYNIDQTSYDKYKFECGENIEKFDGMWDGLLFDIVEVC